MINNNLIDTLVAEYYASRPNLDVPRSPLCVFFFACSGSGKSTMRRLLVEELGVTYVCNDEVRQLLEHYPEVTYQGIELKDVVAKTVEKIFENAADKLIIFDNNIIQYYMHADSYLNVARANTRPIFIIGLKASREELERRIKDRGVDVAQLLGKLPEQLKAYAKATSDITPDAVIKNSADKGELKNLVRQLSALEHIKF